MTRSTRVSRKEFICFVVFILLLASRFALAGEPISNAQWLQLNELRGIPSGEFGPTPAAYVFFDPNCPYSAKLELDAKRFGILGVDLRKVVWIPVAYLRPSSGSKAAALLRAGTYETIIKNYVNFNFAKYEGSTEGVTPTSDELRALDNSKAAMSSLTNSPGTPLIVYKDSSGAVKVQLGLPDKQSVGIKPAMGAYE